MELLVLVVEEVAVAEQMVDIAPAIVLAEHMVEALLVILVTDLVTVEVEQSVSSGQAQHVHSQAQTQEIYE
jgi:hypothetical protein